MISAIDIFLPLILVSSCLAAALFDVFQRRIPNFLCVFTALAGAAFAWTSVGFDGLGGHILHATIALLLGMGLFAAGIIGGGDAKFYTAIAVWFDISAALRLLLSVSIVGVLAVVAWILTRRLMRKKWRKPSDDPHDAFPYGVAIGIGAIATLASKLAA